MYQIIEILSDNELGETVCGIDSYQAAELEIDFLTEDNPGKQYGIFDEQGLSCY
jgi:hypothetical protein